MSTLSDRLCSHCRFPLPASDSGLRHYGTHTAHQENECMRLMHNELDRLTARVVEVEAQLDRVMLEHCPDEMSAEQKERWAKHQAAITRDQFRAKIEAELAKQEPVAWIPTHDIEWLNQNELNTAMVFGKQTAGFLPLYTAPLPEPPDTVRVPREPIKGHRYEVGDWSMRNWEALLEDQGDTP